MELDLSFFLNSVLLGIGLAMDAFSVSMANGLSEPRMKKVKMLEIAGVFAGFQAIMPMAGWLCVHTVIVYFKSFEKFVPWIALALLCFIGVKMIIDGIKSRNSTEEPTGIGRGTLLVQGIATSIDALSVGFTIAEYGVVSAIIASLIIAAVTFAICTAGLIIGKRFGTKLAEKAQIAGGVILIAIGLEIFLKGIL